MLLLANGGEIELPQQECVYSKECTLDSLVISSIFFHLSILAAGHQFDVISQSQQNKWDYLQNIACIK